MKLRNKILVASLPLLLLGYLCYRQVPEKLTLYSLDPVNLKTVAKPDTVEAFHDHRVLGKVEIESFTKRAAIMAEMEFGIATSGFTEAKCFDPRHGLRAVTNGQTTDYVICFECLQIEVHSGSETTHRLTSRLPQPYFNRQLTEAGVPLPKD